MKQVVDQPNGHGSVIYEIGVVLMSRSPREKYCIANTCQETAPYKQEVSSVGSTEVCKQLLQT